MLKKVTVNTKALETMLFIWACLKDREKIADEFFIKLAESPEMEAAYGDGMDANCCRRVLSAIANREMLSDAGLREKRFWNNNMWMTEDMEFTKMMVEPLKTLNLDQLPEQLDESFPYEMVEVIFYPGSTEVATIRDNQLFINFFKLHVDIMNPEAPATIEEKEIPEFVLDQLKQMH